MQAFSICVACLDGKIADRKGYEFIKKIAGTVSGSVGGGGGSAGQEFYGNKPVDGSHVDSEAQVMHVDCIVCLYCICMYVCMYAWVYVCVVVVVVVEVVCMYIYECEVCMYAYMYVYVYMNCM